MVKTTANKAGKTKEINLSEAIMKIIRTLSAPGKKDWDYIEYLVTEAKILDTETEKK